MIAPVGAAREPGPRLRAGGRPLRAGSRPARRRASTMSLGRGASGRHTALTDAASTHRRRPAHLDHRRRDRARQHAARDAARAPGPGPQRSRPSAAGGGNHRDLRRRDHRVVRSARWSTVASTVMATRRRRSLELQSMCLQISPRDRPPRPPLTAPVCVDREPSLPEHWCSVSLHPALVQVELLVSRRREPPRGAHRHRARAGASRHRCHGPRRRLRDRACARARAHPVAQAALRRATLARSARLGAGELADHDR